MTKKKPSQLFELQIAPNAIKPLYHLSTTTSSPAAKKKKKKNKTWPPRANIAHKYTPSARQWSSCSSSTINFPACSTSVHKGVVGAAAAAAPARRATRKRSRARARRRAWFTVDARRVIALPIAPPRKRKRQETRVRLLFSAEIDKGTRRREWTLSGVSLLCDFFFFALLLVLDWGMVTFRAGSRELCTSGVRWWFV